MLGSTSRRGGRRSAARPAEYQCRLGSPGAAPHSIRNHIRPSLCSYGRREQNLHPGHRHAVGSVSAITRIDKPGWTHSCHTAGSMASGSGISISPCRVTSSWRPRRRRGVSYHWEAAAWRLQGPPLSTLTRNKPASDPLMLIISNYEWYLRLSCLTTTSLLTGPVHFTWLQHSDPLHKLE